MAGMWVKWEPYATSGFLEMAYDGVGLASSSQDFLLVVVLVR
jgi:hypothetical protein